MILRYFFNIPAITLFLLSSTSANATLFEDFDGGGTTPFTLTNTSGGAPSIIGGGPSGNFLRLTNLNGSNNNSIAFDEEASQTGPAPTGLVLSFDFRMTDDATNAAAGGCCGSAADGLGIGIFSTATYGSTGGSNPGAGGGIWERPSFADAFTIGLDIFQNIDVVNLNWAGVQITEIDVGLSFGLDLNDNIFHRAIVTINPDAGNALVNMDIISDVFGTPSTQNIFTDQAIAGLDLTSLPNYRLIAGGRTGGAFTEGDMDNISLASIPTSVPEPATLVLLGLGLAGIGFARKKKQN